jgi:hypothetical protein
MSKCSDSYDIVTSSRELYKTNAKKASIFAVNKKVMRCLLLRKECNELLVIHVLISSVTVLLQLLVTCI